MLATIGFFVCLLIGIAVAIVGLAIIAATSALGKVEHFGSLIFVIGLLVIWSSGALAPFTITYTGG